MFLLMYILVFTLPSPVYDEMVVSPDCGALTPPAVQKHQTVPIQLNVSPFVMVFCILR